MYWTSVNHWYYRLMMASYREQKPDGSYPAIIINSIDLKKMLDWFAANELIKATAYFFCTN